MCHLAVSRPTIPFAVPSDTVALNQRVSDFSLIWIASGLPTIRSERQGTSPDRAFPTAACC
jgi:hypothetical protein